jgi:hypothetical protein
MELRQLRHPGAVAKEPGSGPGRRAAAERRAPALQPGHGHGTANQPGHTGAAADCRRRGQRRAFDHRPHVDRPGRVPPGLPNRR